LLKAEQRRLAELWLQTQVDTISRGLREKMARIGKPLVLPGVAIFVAADEIVFAVTDGNSVPARPCSAADGITISEAAKQIVEATNGLLQLLPEAWRREEARIAGLSE
jgi:hypothetical protein